MPLYDYDCAACGRRFEVIHGVHSDPPATCPLCGKGPIRKTISAPAVHYKGSGWAKKERRTPAPTAASTSATDGPSGKDGGATSEGGSSSDGSSSEAPTKTTTKATETGATTKKTD